MKQVPLECPVCGAMIVGRSSPGFFCSGCKAHFSIKFISHLRKNVVRELLQIHFGEKNQSTVMVVQDVPKKPMPMVEHIELTTHKSVVKSSLSQTAQALHNTNQRLETLLGVQEEVQNRKVPKKRVTKKQKVAKKHTRRR